METQQQKLFPEIFNKKFEGLIKVLEGSSKQATLEVSGLKITFGWAKINNEKKFIEISPTKESQQYTSNSMDIPRKLYNYAKNIAKKSRKITLMRKEIGLKKTILKTKKINSIFFKNDSS